MAVNSTGKANSPRQRRTKTQGENIVAVENNQNKTVSTDKPKTEETTETTQKPVQAELSSKLDIRKKSALSIRPTKSSELKVVETIDIMGVRPIAAHTVDVVDTITASGVRPIAASHLAISEKYSLMGNRPIMAKMSDESDSLMGFLD
ncbi:MAG: hypothetical protein HRU34_10055 [Richelia sp.]|nr:hypothetical protein [Richelia sp.]CDN10765.1 hypothetical protein RintRC_2145 [Richelia intracellularis]